MDEGDTIILLTQSQELQFSGENSDKLNEVQGTTKEPTRKKTRRHELLSDSEDESLISLVRHPRKQLLNDAD